MTTAAVPPDPGHPPDVGESARERCFAVDVARILGLGYEAVHKFRRISLAEGGAGPMGLPPRDGYVMNRPWWYRETVEWWGTATGRLHPYTAAPQRLAPSTAPHPCRPTVATPDPGVFRALVGDDTPLHLADVAEVSGYPVETVKRKFRHTSIAEGGMGPVGMPLPDGYDEPAFEESKPWRPWFRAGPVRWWLIATGRMSPCTGEPMRR